MKPMLYGYISFRLATWSNASRNKSFELRVHLPRDDGYRMYDWYIMQLVCGDKVIYSFSCRRGIDLLWFKDYFAFRNVLVNHPVEALTAWKNFHYSKTDILSSPVIGC
jgi:hypothetical protein